MKTKLAPHYVLFFLAALTIHLAPFATHVSAQGIMDDEFKFSKANEIVGAQHAHKVGADGSSVLIAIADTGTIPDARMALVELDGKVGTRYDYYDFDDDGTNYPILEYRRGHRTAIIAAGRRNGIGGQGIAYNASLNSYRVSSFATYQPRGAINVARAFWRMRQDQVDVMSGAWGWRLPQRPKHYNAAFMRSFLRPMAQQIALMNPNEETGYRGTALVFNVGRHYHSDPANLMAMIPFWYPELQSKIMAVVSLDVTDWESGDSVHKLKLDKGTARCGVAKDWCVAAPGSGFNFYWPTGEIGVTPAAASATATAVAVGSVALLMDAFPEISAEDAIAIILETATDIGGDGVDNMYGHGLINLEAALQPVGTLSFNGASGLVSAAGSAFGDSTLLGDGFSQVVAEAPIIYQDKYGRYFEGGTAVANGSGDVEPLDLADNTGGGANKKIKKISDGLGLTDQGGLVWSTEDKGISFIAGRRSDRAIVPNGVLPFDHMGRDAVVSMMTNKAWDANAKSRWFVGVVGTEKMPMAFGTWRYALDENVSFQTGLSAEQGKLYGTQGRGAFAFKGQTLTQWAGLAGAWNLGEKTTLTADMQAGYLNYRHDTPLGLTQLSGVMAKAGATLASYDVFMGGDQFQLFAGVPAIMLNAEAELKMPDRGFARSQSVQFNNRPEVEVKAAWRLRF